MGINKRGKDEPFRESFEVKFFKSDYSRVPSSDDT